MQIPLLSQMAAKSNQKLLYENELKDSHQSLHTVRNSEILFKKSQARENRKILKKMTFLVVLSYSKYF